MSTFSPMDVSGFNDSAFLLLPMNCSLLDHLEADFSLNETNCTNEEARIFDGEDSTVHPIAKAVAQLFYGMAFVIGLCGNSLVIYVVIRFSKMQTVTNFYLLNLALADELFVFGIPFIMATSAIDYWPFGSIMCKLFMIATSLNQFTSSLLLTIMSADRYIAICHPISAPKLRTPVISKFVSVTAWTIAALMIVPVFMYSNTLEVAGRYNCNIFWPDGLQVSGQTVFTLYSFVLAFGIPFILIFIFYSLVIHKLRKSGLRSKSKQKRKNHKKVTKLVLTVIVVYLICWLPYWILQLALIYTPPKKFQSPIMVAFFLISSCLSYINSAINPILYAFLSDNFKKSFLKACTCATRSDANNALQAENSMFPRRRKSNTGTPETLRSKRPEQIDSDKQFSSVRSHPLVPRDDAFVNGKILVSQL